MSGSAPASNPANKRSASSDPPTGAARGMASSNPPDSPAAARLLEGIDPQPLPPALQAWADSLPGDLRYVLDAIAAAGGAAWPVGGCVRDVLCGRVPREVDVCTSLTPEALVAIFPDAVPHRQTGGAFLTTSITRGSVVLEVTTIRTEGAYVDGRRPERVDAADRLVDDLARRDFTINAAAVDVGRGLLLDPYGGAGDAMAGVLRCVGDPAARLVDDGLRVWRAYRFLDAGPAGQRTPDAALAAALASPPVQAAAARVSRERVWEELAKVLVGQHAAAVIRVMAQQGALATALGDPAVDTAPTAPGVLAQADVLPAWRRLHARARATGLNPHSGEPTAKGGAASSAPPARPGASPSCEDAPPPPFLHATPPPPRFVLALDLEATCDAPKSPQPQEVIEVGAVLLEVVEGGPPPPGARARTGGGGDADLEGPPLTLTPVAEFHSHCRPTLHPTLSDFCVTFTGVTQADVDGAPGLAEVLASLTAWLVERGALAGVADAGGPGKFVAATVGDWDLETLVPRQLEAVAGSAGGGRDPADDDAPPAPPALAPPPWAAAWCDAGVLYREHYLRPRAGLAQMLGDLGLPLAGRPHAALADAQGLAVLLARLAADGAAPLVTRSASGGVAAYVGDAPDLAVARIALLLAGAGPAAAGRAAKALKLGRHEARRVAKAVAAVGRLPDGSDAAAMRLFRAAMGSQLVLQLLLEASLSAGGDTSARLDAFVEEWRRLPPLRAGAAPLLDGAALMAATGLKPGRELGRLKDWLWRVQVERDLGSVEEVRGVLEGLEWRGTDCSQWPGMEWT